MIGHKPATGACGWGLRHSSSSRSVEGEWYPPGGEIILEFDAVFRRTFVRGVVYYCSGGYTPGDEVMIEKRTTK